MDGIALLLMLAALLAALPLFFVKTRRKRKIVLYTSGFIFVIASIIAVLDSFSLYFEHFEASRFAKWFIHNLIGLEVWLIPAGIPATVILAGAFFSHFRMQKNEKPDTAVPACAALIINHAPMFSIARICGLTIVSGLAVLTLSYARAMTVEKYRYGKSVDLPKMSYGKAISYNCENYILTIGPNGEISNLENKICLAEMEYELVELIKENPRGKHYLMDAEGQVTQDEYVDDIVIHLRVDERCTYRDMQPVLRVLERRKIRWAWFRVAEE